MHPKLTPYHNSRRNLTSHFFGTGSNHTTAVIIIVVCATAGMFILFCLFRFFRHSWARGSTPLPPMQPIASYREQRLTEFVERSNRFTTYQQLPYLPPPLESSPAATDSFSLHVTEEETSPSRKSSLYTEEKGNVQDEEEVLRIPDAANNLSSSSLVSLPSTPPSASVALSSPSQATLPHSYHAMSAVSRTSIRSARSSGRIGVPHGPHSQVNVILPSPLAPAMYPYMSGPEAGRLGIDGPHMSVRSSLVDMWAPPLHRSVSTDHIGSNSPTVPGTHWRRASPSHTRRRPSSYHTSPLSYRSSSSDSPTVPPIPTHQQWVA